MKLSKLWYKDTKDKSVLFTNACLFFVRSPAVKCGLFWNKYSAINISNIASPKNSSLS